MKIYKMCLKDLQNTGGFISVHSIVETINKNVFNTKIDREDVIKAIQNMRQILGDIQIHGDYLSIGDNFDFKDF